MSKPEIKRTCACTQTHVQSITKSSVRTRGAIQDASTAGVARRSGVKSKHNSPLLKQENPMAGMGNPVALRRVLTRNSTAAALLPALSCVPASVAAPVPSHETLSAAMSFANNHPSWNNAQKQLLKTCVAGIGRAVSQIRARRSGQPFDPKHIDLASIAFDMPAINRDLEGQSYRQAGFNTAKSFTNAKWGFRRVCRTMGTITSKARPILPPDSVYAQLVAATPRYRRSAVKRFASELHQMGISPEQVQDDLVTAHGNRLLADMVGVNVTTTLRWIVRVWNKGSRHGTGRIAR